jgi:hypothetical protein
MSKVFLDPFSLHLTRKSNLENQRKPRWNFNVVQFIEVGFASKSNEEIFYPSAPIFPCCSWKRGNFQALLSESRIQAKA